MSFSSVLGKHRDRDRPKLRAIVAAYLARRPAALGSDPASLARRQREVIACAATAGKSLAAQMIHQRTDPTNA